MLAGLTGSRFVEELIGGLDEVTSRFGQDSSDRYWPAFHRASVCTRIRKKVFPPQARQKALQGHSGELCERVINELCRQNHRDGTTTRWETSKCLGIRASPGGEYGRIRDLSPGEAKMSTVKSGKQKLVTGRLCGQRRPPDNHCRTGFRNDNLLVF